MLHRKQNSQDFFKDLDHMMDDIYRWWAQNNGSGNSSWAELYEWWAQNNGGGNSSWQELYEWWAQNNGGGNSSWAELYEWWAQSNGGGNSSWQELYEWWAQTNGGGNSSWQELYEWWAQSNGGGNSSWQELYEWWAQTNGGGNSSWQELYEWWAQSNGGGNSSWQEISEDELYAFHQQVNQIWWQEVFFNTQDNGNIESLLLPGESSVVGPAVQVAIEGNQDRIIGGDFENEEIIAGAGDDLIDGAGGDDTIFGAAGNDTVFAFDGNDSIQGGDGDDVLSGESGNDALLGETGDDVLMGGENDDYLDGGEGRDFLNGQRGNDALVGRAGDDALEGESGQDLLVGGEGKDIGNGGFGDDIIYGDAYTGSLGILSSANSSSSDSDANTESLLNHQNVQAFYQFAEGSGTSTQNLKSSNYDLNLHNGVQWVTNSQENHSTVLDFDGSDDYGTIDGLETGGAMTFSAWVNYDSFQNWSPIFDFGDAEFSDNIYLANQGTTNNLGFAIESYSNNNDSYAYFSIDDFWQLDTWIHLTATIDETGWMRVYKNGELAGEHDGGVVPQKTVRTGNSIGQFNTSGLGAFDGQLDDIVILDSALDSNEVQSFYEDSLNSIGSNSTNNNTEPEPTPTSDSTNSSDLIDLTSLFEPTAVNNFDPYTTNILNHENLQVLYQFAEGSGLSTQNLKSSNYDLNLYQEVKWATNSQKTHSTILDLDKSNQGRSDYGFIEGLETGGAMTFSAWVNFDSWQDWSRIFSFGDNTGDANTSANNVNRIWLANRENSDGLNFRIYGSDGVTFSELDIDDFWSTETWIHVTASVDETGLMRVYKNGELAGELAGGVVPVKKIRAHNYLGAGDAYNNPFDGQLDDVMIFDTALDSNEVQSFYEDSLNSLTSNITTPDTNNLVLAQDPIRLEAEDFAWTGDAHLSSHGFASGGELVTSESDVQEISGTNYFTGETGVYDIVIGYHDLENTGTISVSLDDNQIDNWSLTDDLNGANTPELASFRTRVIENVDVSYFDSITINAQKDGDDKAYIDYVEFIPVDTETTSNTSVANIINNQNVQAFYQFEEGSGSLTQNASSSNHDLNLHNGVEWVTNTQENHSTVLDFDGVDDYGTIDSLETGGAMTFSAWVNYDSFNGWSRIFNFGDNTGSAGTSANNVNRIVLSNKGTTNNLRFRIFGSDGVTNSTVDIDNFWSTDTWIHVTATVDETGLMRVYKNGELAGELAGGIVPVEKVRNHNYIGSRDSSGNKFDGQLDDVIILDSALDSNEVQSFYQDSLNSIGSNNTSSDTNNLVLAQDPIHVEAESLSWSQNYTQTNENYASGGSLIQNTTANYWINGWGNFTGETGVYDIVVGYDDTNTYGGAINVQVNNITVDSVQFFDNPDNGNLTGGNAKTHTIRNVSLNENDNFYLKIFAQGLDSGERSLDYVKFVPVVTEPDPTPEPEPTPDPTPIELPDGVNLGENSDILRGGFGNDAIDGGKGNDIIFGEDELDNSSYWVGWSDFRANDTIFGGAGDDQVYGNSGDDVIYGDNSSSINHGLVAHLAFEEGTGIQPVNSVDNQPGYLLGTETDDVTWTDGKIGTGVNFSGDYGYVHLSHNDALDITDTITLSAWIKADTIDDEDGIIRKSDSGDHYSYGMKLTAGGNLVFKTSSGEWQSNNQINTGQWHHVAVSYDGSEIKFYIDGQQDSNVISTNMTLESTDESIWIGTHTSRIHNGISYSYSYHKFDGIIDEVGIHNRALSATEIAELASLESNSNVAAGEDGNDNLFGNGGHDILTGGAGYDTLNGTDPIVAGYLERDILTGGAGADTFILGDATQPYYATEGNQDYATIKDFDPLEDVVQLYGSSSNYSQDGNNLYHNGDLIGIFEGTTSWDLNSNDFAYV